ncbi:MAG: glycosyltransferase family 4 protein [Candidatus Latescibacterota bacterium]|nr:glycosyltransferase family 4 protein [Candidatus Latescibacterota bacterium]
MSLRVAHVFPTDRVAYLMRAQLMRLQEQGFAVSVICGDRGYGDRLRDCGLDVVQIPFARELKPWTDMRCLWALRRELGSGRYDIAHSHNPKGTLLGPVAGRWAKVRAVVHTVHGFLFNENSRGLHRLAAEGAERWCARWSDDLLFQSQEDFDYARIHHYKAPERLHLIGNGVDERRFGPALHPQARAEKRAELGFGEGDLVVGMVTRLVREKGCVEFFAMAERIAGKWPQARFLMVGIPEGQDQSDAVEPAQLMREHGVAERCIALEHRTDMPELYAAMDILTLPSYREGIPRAVIEAGAMGLAVVASDIRGCREVVVEGETGLLFPLRDVEAFAAAVERLLDDVGLRQRLGRAGRERVMEHYTEARTTERVIACYRQCLEEGRRG